MNLVKGLARPNVSFGVKFWAKACFTVISRVPMELLAVFSISSEASRP